MYQKRKMNGLIPHISFFYWISLQKVSNECTHDTVTHWHTKKKNWERTQIKTGIIK